MYPYKINKSIKKIVLQSVWQEDMQRKETERREEKGKERNMSVKWAAYTQFYTEIKGENIAYCRHLSIQNLNSL